MEINQQFLYAGTIQKITSIEDDIIITIILNSNIQKRGYWDKNGLQEVLDNQKHYS